MTIWARRLAKLWLDCAGSNAVEFALVAPVFILVILGGFNVAGMMFAESSLHYAAESAARCASVQKTVCTSASAIQNYALAHYPATASGTPAFTYNANGCGHTVNGAVTYVVNAGIWQATVPLASTACFP